MTVVAGYTRISRRGGRKGQGYISKEDQREGCSFRADGLGLEIGAWFHDEDYTGGNMQRPQWEAVMAAIRDPANPIGGVIVVRVDRFARTVPEGAPEVKAIWDADGVFVAADLPLDTTTPEGRVMLWQWLTNAEYQLEMIKKGWQRAKKRAIERGAHIGRTPLGMGRVPKGEDAAGTLFILDDWGALLTAIFEHAAASPLDTTTTLMRWAERNTPRPDGRCWTATSIGQVLRNRVYRGEVAYKPRKGKFAALRKEDAHEPLVPEEVWQAAQRRHGTPRSMLRGALRVSILQGVIRCQGCRYALAPLRMAPSAGREHRDIYRCRYEHAAGRCPQPALVMAHLIEPLVMDRIKDQIRMSERLTAVTDGRHMAALQATWEEARDDRTTIEGNAGLAARHPESWERALGAAHAIETERRLAYHEAVRNARGAIPALDPTFDWSSVTPDDWHDEIVPSMIDAIFVRRSAPGRRQPTAERLSIVWRGEVDLDDLPGRGCHGTGIESFVWPQ